MGGIPPTPPFRPPRLEPIKAAEGGKYVVLGAKKSEADALYGFSESIKSDILKDALEANYSLRDLEKAMSV